MRLSPAIAGVEAYPFEALDRAKARAIELGRSVIDFGVGDPREVTPEFIRAGLIDALDPISSYPRAAGLPELREAIQAWVRRRFGVALDPGSELLPTLGSKEIVFSLAAALLDVGAGRDLVVTTSPGYTIPERGARYAGGEVLRLPIGPDSAFLPDLDAVDDATWSRVALLWTNYPNNPTGAVAPLEFYERVAELARRHEFLWASDEAYAELYFDDPPVSALQVTDRTNVLAVHTLSKRSSMTGYRSGFVAGDPSLIAALKRLRPSVGVTPQEFVQRASSLAWADESHVEANRAAYGRKRQVFLDLFADRGIEVAGSVATFYLWVRVPGGGSSADFALGLFEGTGVVVAPGSYFGPEGEGYVRMAMVPAVVECEEAARRLSGALEEVHT